LSRGFEGFCVQNYFPSKNSFYSSLLLKELDGLTFYSAMTEYDSQD